MKYTLLIETQEMRPVAEGEEQQANSLRVDGLTYSQALAISKFLEARGMNCTLAAFGDDYETMRWSEMQRGKASEFGEKLDKPKIITADGVEICAVMSIEDLYRLMGETPKTRPPLMMRKDGVMFREVVIGK